MSFFGGILKGLGSAAKFVGKVGAAGATTLSHAAGSLVGVDPVQIGHDLFDKKPVDPPAYTGYLPQTPTIQLFPNKYQSTATPPYLGGSNPSSSGSVILDNLAAGVNSLFGKINLPTLHVEGDLASPTKSNLLPWLAIGAVLLLLMGGSRRR